jgi:hypothetical protein
MTVVVERAISKAEAPAYRRRLDSARIAIAAVCGIVLIFALVAMVELSPVIGGAALVVAAAVGLLDAMFATPTRLDVDGDGVTLGFWKRVKRYEARHLVVTHEVPRGRFTITKRNKKRVLVQFNDDGDDAVNAFVGAGVEVVSK